MNYTGIKCPVCGLPFQEEDDVVVCPDCGAPYHRHCYEQEGKCVFADTHETGKRWAPPVSEADTAEHKEELVCPACGRHNQPDAAFCNQCGTPIGTQQSAAPGGYQDPYQSPGYQNPGGETPPDPNAYPFNGFPPQGASPFHPITISAEEPLEPDITAGEMAKYVQNNSPYFLAVFFGIQKKRQSRFSFSAFLFSGGWLLYRKIYKIGAIITGLMLALFLTNTIVSAYFSTPLLLGLYEQAGVSVTAYPSYEELMRITELVYQLDAGSIFLLFTPLITLSLQFSVMLYCGFNANRLYYRHCVDSIRTIKARNLEADVYEQTLVETGGVNISLALSLLICYSLIIYLPNLFI